MKMLIGAYCIGNANRSAMRLTAYLKAVRPHAWWYVTCGPLAVEGLIEQSAHFYGIDVSPYLAPEHVTALLTLLAFIGVFCSGFLAWRDADDDRRQAKKQLEDSTRPQFVAEITRVEVQGLHARADWISVFVYMTIRNLGVESSIGGWQLKVVPPQPATLSTPVEC